MQEVSSFFPGFPHCAFATNYKNYDENLDMVRRRLPVFALLSTSLILLSGCDSLIQQDMASLLLPRFQRSEIVGFLAGFGTTFAAVPDLVSMLRRGSSKGMSPRMAAIMGVFQILWVYYGLLIVSRPVIAWNLIAVLTNSFSVGAYLYFVRKESSTTRDPGSKI
jgi:MtN3 and saliva related transmembrane protein